MAAMIVKGPPHWGQCSRSISNTRLSSRAQSSRTLTFAESIISLPGFTTGYLLGRPFVRLQCLVTLDL